MSITEPVEQAEQEEAGQSSGLLLAVERIRQARDRDSEGRSDGGSTGRSDAND